MKRSDMNKARELMSELDRLDGMRDNLESFPPMTAYLNVDGASFKVPLSIAREIVGNERERVVGYLSEIGIDPYN